MECRPVASCRAIELYAIHKMYSDAGWHDWLNRSVWGAAWTHTLLCELESRTQFTGGMLSCFRTIRRQLYFIFRGEIFVFGAASVPYFIAPSNNRLVHEFPRVSQFIVERACVACPVRCVYPRRHIYTHILQANGGRIKNKYLLAGWLTGVYVWHECLCGACEWRGTRRTEITKINTWNFSRA